MGSDLSLPFLESSAVPDGPERIVYVLRNNEYVRQNGSGQEYLPTSAVFRAQAPPSLEHADVRIAPGRVHAKSVEAIGGERERTVTIRAEVDAQQPIRVRVRKPIGGTDGVAGAGLGFGDDGVVLQSGLRQVWHSKAIRLNASSFATETQLMILVQSVKEGRPAIEECTLVKLVCTGGAKPAYHAEVVEQYVSLDGIEYKMNELYGKTKGISGTSEELGEPVFANEALCVVCLMMTATLQSSRADISACAPRAQILCGCGRRRARFADTRCGLCCRSTEAKYRKLQVVLGLRRRTRPMETVQLMGAAGAAHRKTQRQVESLHGRNRAFRQLQASTGSPSSPRRARTRRRGYDCLRAGCALAARLSCIAGGAVAGRRGRARLTLRASLLTPVTAFRSAKF